MSNLICNGWEIFFHAQLFGQQYQQLVDRVTLLKQRLPEAEFKTHATVKLFAAITVGIESKIPTDPFASSLRRKLRYPSVAQASCLLAVETTALRLLNFRLVVLATLL